MLLLLMRLLLWLPPPLLPPLAMALATVSVQAADARAAINLMDEVFICSTPWRNWVGKSIGVCRDDCCPVHKLLRAGLSLLQPGRFFVNLPSKQGKMRRLGGQANWNGGPAGPCQAGHRRG